MPAGSEWSEFRVIDSGNRGSQALGAESSRNA